MTRQVEYGRGAAVIGRAVDIAGLNPQDHYAVAQLIPGLVEHYLEYCPTRDQAPLEQCGPHRGTAKMMALVRLLLRTHELAKPKESELELVVGLEEPHGKIALARAARMVCEAAHGKRQLQAFMSRRPDNLMETTFLAECEATGGWPECLSELKKTGLFRARRNPKLHPSLDLGPLLQAEDAMLAERNRRLRDTAPYARVGVDDEHLRAVAQWLLVEAQKEQVLRIVGDGPAGRRVGNLQFRSLCQKLFQSGGINPNQWICKGCGYLNSNASDKCRGNPNATFERRSREIKPAQRSARQETRHATMRVTIDRRYTKETQDDAERHEDVLDDCPNYSPAVRDDGVYVVPCDKDISGGYGGALISARGQNWSQSPPCAVFKETEEGKGRFEAMLGGPTAQALKDELGKPNTELQDMIAVEYTRWRSAVQAHASKTEAAAIMKQLKEVVNRFWDHPSAGGRHCQHCRWMDASWEDTASRVAQADSDRTIVR